MSMLISLHTILQACWLAGEWTSGAEARRQPSGASWCALVSELNVLKLGMFSSKNAGAVRILVCL